MLFPLPLTNCEEYLVRDDYPAYPNTIYGRFRFSGQLDPKAVETASRIAVARHPLIRANVQKKRGKFYWVEPSEAVHIMGMQHRSEVDDYPHMPAVDLSQQVGGRVYFTHDDDSVDVTFQVHHGCCDGLAALQVIVDWMLAYAQAYEHPEKEPKLRQVCADDLKQRGDYGFKTWKYWKMAHRQAIGLAGVYEFMAHRAVEMVPDSLSPVDQPPPAPYPRAVTHEFDPEILNAHRQAASTSEVTTNELFLRDLLIALNKWRTEKGYARESDWMRIMVPINMRELRHRRLPAANRVSFISVDRQPRSCEKPKALLRSLRGQMHVIQQNHLDLTFLMMLNAFRKLPGGLRRMARAERCGATCLLTNLGEPMARVALPKQEGKLVVGNLLLNGIDLLAPLRPKTNASISVFRYAGKLCLTLNYDPRIFNRETATEFLSSFVEQIKHSIRELT